MRLKPTGKPVVWGGLVSVESSAMSRDYSSFNGIVREQAEAKGLRFVDMWNGFADEDGKYVSVGPDVRGQSVQLRADDGLNFTRAGQRKLAYFVEQQLNDMFGGTGASSTAVNPPRRRLGHRRPHRPDADARRTVIVGRRRSRAARRSASAAAWPPTFPHA